MLAAASQGTDWRTSGLVEENLCNKENQIKSPKRRIEGKKTKNRSHRKHMRCKTFYRDSFK